MTTNTNDSTLIVYARSGNFQIVRMIGDPNGFQWIVQENGSWFVSTKTFCEALAVITA